MRVAFAATPSVATRIIEVVDEGRALAVVNLLRLLASGAITFVERAPVGDALDMLYALNPAIRSAVALMTQAQKEALVSSEKAAVLGNLRTSRAKVEDLATRLFADAKAGKQPDGTPFSWTKWKAIARTTADGITWQVADRVRDSWRRVAEAITGLAVRTKEVVTGIVDCVLDPKACAPKIAADIPWWAWAAGGLYVAVQVRSLAR